MFFKDFEKECFHVFSTTFLNLIPEQRCVYLLDIKQLLHVRATLYACFLPCLIQLFFEKYLRETRNSIEVFRKIIELDEAENRCIK